MDILKKLDLTLPQFLKLAGLAILALIVLSFLSSLVGNPLSFGLNNARDKSVSSAPSIGIGMEGGESVFYDSDDGVMLSSRNVTSMSISPEENYTPGSDAEDFEVKEYHSTIESRDTGRDCALVNELKSESEVIFENAHEGDKSCSYTFKVENASVPDVLALLEDLDPKELTERSYTIKRQIDDYTSEIEILETKLASINATLESAIAQYDDITALATRVADVESLAKIINSKLSIIERLTQEQINTISQLERINRSKADQLDRLNYTYFYVSIYENKYVDGDRLKDSWKASVQRFVYEVNKTIQDLSVGLLALLLVVFKYVIYFFILLFVVRFGWEITQKVWRK